MAAGRSAQLARMREKRAALRKQLWGDLDPGHFWHRKTHDGYMTTPRTMPLVLQIIDTLTNGKPASSTYFSLWSRTRDDDSMVIIDNPKDFSLEAGFSGSRSVTTWTSRMRLLQDLHFIEAQKGTHEFHYVLIWNPHLVIKRLFAENKIQDKEFYNFFVARSIEIGCKDFMENKDQPLNSD